MITDHEYTFFLAFFFATLTLGTIFGYSLAKWRIKQLKDRVELLQLISPYRTRDASKL